MYRSVSNDVFQNLALEDWIFHNIGMKCRRIVLLWRNQPCVGDQKHILTYSSVTHRTLCMQVDQVIYRISSNSDHSYYLFQLSPGMMRVLLM